MSTSETDVAPLCAACFTEKKAGPLTRYNQTRYFDEKLRSVTIDDVATEKFPGSPIQLVPLGGGNFERCMQNLLLNEFVPQPWNRGVVKVVSRRTAVYQHVGRAAVPSAPKPHG